MSNGNPQEEPKGRDEIDRLLEIARQQRLLDDPELSRLTEMAFAQQDNRRNAIVAGLQMAGVLPKTGDEPVPSYAETGKAMLGAAAGVVSGVAKKGVLEPILNALDLVGIDAPKDNYQKRLAQGYVGAADAVALQMGVKPEALESLNDIGAFLGFMIPATGSIKAASLGGRGLGMAWAAAKGQSYIPAAIPKLLTPMQITRDFVGGAIYGFVFREGEDIGDRINNALNESAAFGVFSLALSGTGAARSFWNRRAFDRIQADAMAVKMGLAEGKALGQRAAELGLSRGPIDPVTGVSPLVMVGPRTGKLGGELLSEIEIISMSPQAEAMWRAQVPEQALIEGIVNYAGSRATHGVVRGIPDLNAARTAVSNVRRDVSHLKFEVLKNSEGTYDIIYGTTGLSNRLKAQYKTEGMFEGQEVLYKGSEGFTYVGRAAGRESGGKRVDAVKVRDRATGEEHIFNAEHVTPHTFGAPPTPILEAIGPQGARIPVLVRDFENWFFNNIDELSRSRAELSEAQIIQEIRAGRLTLDPEARRAFSGGDVIVHPEEALLAPDGFPTVRFRATPAKQGLDLVGPDGKRVAPIPLEPGPEPRSLSIPAGKLDEAFDQIPTGNLYAIGEDILQAIKEKGIDRIYYQGYMLAESAEGSIIRRGLNDAWPLAPEEFANFEQIVDVWLKERGITDIADRMAFRAYAAQQLRQGIYNRIPKEEKALLEALKREIAIEDRAAGYSLERMAASRGFHVERLQDGTILSRDMNSGKPTLYSDEATAWEAIKAKTSAPNLMPTDPLPPDIINMIGYNAPPVKGLKETGWLLPESAPEVIIEDMVPRQFFTNLRDWLIRIEEGTGLKLWTGGFNLIDEGTQAMRAELRTIVPNVSKLWKGLGHEERLQVMQWWKRWMAGDAGIISQELALADAKAMGLSPKQIRAGLKTMEIMDDIFSKVVLESGETLNGKQVIRTYYRHIQPYIQKHGVWDFKAMLADTELASGLPHEVRALVNYLHTGELPMGEVDPLLVTLKMIRTNQFNKHVYPYWRRIRDLVDETKVGVKVAPKSGKIIKPANWLGLGELPKADRDKILMALGGNNNFSLEGNSGLNALVKALQEYTALMRGYPSADQRGLRDITRRVFRKIGIKADERIMEDLLNSYLATMYGSAMGLRPMLVTRNLMQNYWTSYLRLGGKYGGESAGRALSYEGFVEALEAGAIRSESAGVFMGEVILDNMIANTNAMQANGLFSLGAKSTIAGVSRLGRLSRRITEKTLYGYTSADDLNRAWAFHWQKMHTQEFLDKYMRGVIGREQFIEQGLPFYSKTVQNEFFDRLSRLGKNNALSFIGKMAADENHFIYGAFAQPLWMQKPFGRLFGQFGTWPIWYKEMIVHRMRNGTVGQRAAFLARLGIISGMTTSIALQTGLDIWSWLAPGSIVSWFGGPAVDYIYDMRNIVQSPYQDKPKSIQRLGARVGRLFFPGQTFMRDMGLAFNNATHPADVAAAIMIGRPELSRISMTDFTLAEDYLLQAEPFSEESRRNEHRATVLKDRAFKAPDWRERAPIPPDSLRTPFRISESFRFGGVQQLQQEPQE